MRKENGILEEPCRLAREAAAFFSEAWNAGFFA
jgi:hypothetical protein